MSASESVDAAVLTDLEARKAGGVYYTPAYIVDYIVRQTVGHWVEGRSPQQVGGWTDQYHLSKRRRPLKILDPACGEGAFLLGAYKFLLGWYLERYMEQGPESHARGVSPRLFQHPSGEWRLTVAERKRILLAHIHGVDLDSQAVEVTKLSLLLRVFEGEDAETLGAALTLVKERELPDLSNNIKCGNSLIGPDYHDACPLDTLEEDEMARINAFSWQDEFGEVLGSGRFDMLIGNPPYCREKDFKYLLDEIAVTAFGQRHRSPRMDLWYYFVHRGLELLGEDGVLSFITNAYWLSGTGAEKLIGAMEREVHLEELFDLAGLEIFKGVSGRHLIFRLRKTAPGEPTRILRVPEHAKTGAARYVAGEGLTVFDKDHEQVFHDGKIDMEKLTGTILQRLDGLPTLQGLGKVRQGIAENPSAINRKTNGKWGERWVVGEGVFTLRQEEVQALKLKKKERSLLRPYHDLCDLGRYWTAAEPSLSLIYATRHTCPDINNYPRLKAHLDRFKVIMEQRRETENGSNQWWHLHWPRDEAIWRAAKILCIQMAGRPTFSINLEPCYVPFSVNVFVPDEDQGLDLNYLLGVLNSRLLWLWFKHNAKRRGVGLEINCNVLRRAPILLPDLADLAQRDLHQRISSQAQLLLKLNQRLVTASTAHLRTTLARQLETTDRNLDARVCEMYGLTAEETEEVVAATAM